MANRWEDVEELFVNVAEDDLVREDYVTPVLAVFTGDRLRFLAWLRPFEKGQYEDPMIELLCMAMGLHADRLAFGVTGRAWSLEDPIPPVTDDVDLRQRVHFTYMVDGTRGKPKMRCTLRPFEHDGGTVTWQEPSHLDGGEGRIPDLLLVTVRDRRKFKASFHLVVEQAQRVERLGHAVYWAPDMVQALARHLGDAGTPGRPHCRPTPRRVAR